MPDGLTVAATIILLFPMLYFFLASPAFLLVKLDIPSVTRLLRGMFSIHFRVAKFVGIVGAAIFAIAGQSMLAMAVAAIAALTVLVGHWLLRHFDAELGARDAGDASAVRRLRLLHCGGMLYNALQLAAVVIGLPYLFIAP